MEAILNKTCSKCGTIKPATIEYFPPRGKRLKSWCRECIRIDSRAKYALEPEKYLARTKASQAKRADYYRERSLENYRANPQKFVENNRSWRAKNRDRANENQRRYYHENRDRYVAHSRNYQLKKKAAGNYSEADVRHLFNEQQGCCAYCGNKFGEAYEIEHVIPVSRGGMNLISNLVLACTRCNRQKSSKTPDEWVHRWYLTPPLLTR